MSTYRPLSALENNTQPHGALPHTPTLTERGARRIDNPLERMNFLPLLDLEGWAGLETGIHDYMGRFCESFTGKYWHFWAVPDGGFFLSPKREGNLHFCVPQRLKVSVSAEAAGMALTLCAIRKEWKRQPGREKAAQLAACYRPLYDFAVKHAEARAILALLFEIYD